MRSVLSRAVTGAALSFLALGCATASEDTGSTSTGSGGTGGSASTSSTVAASSSHSASSSTSQSSSVSSSASTTASSTVSTGSGPTMCGNGVIDPPETCDGTDFGGKTCVDFGLSGGFLLCNPFCSIVVANCTPAESCTNQQDDDMDGFTDCDDPDCATATACTDACSVPTQLQIGNFQSGQIDGRPNLLTSSCVPQAGREIVFALTAPTTGDISVQAPFASFDVGLSVRTTCSVPASEIACVNQTGSGGTESLTIAAIAGQTYYIVLESVSNQGGFYDIIADQIMPESACSDFNDNDFDGFLDCDDPSACQGSFECQSGTTAVGQPCFNNTNCHATNGDPICLPVFKGFTNGYCSEFCNLQTNDCPGGAQCYQIGLSTNGVCMQSCLTENDCAPGYACVNHGLPSKVCDKPPELNCGDNKDNDGDGFVDCEDVTSCSSSSPACVPGAKAVGASCQLHNECQANANDPFCIDQFNFGWPGGYCAEFCNLGTNDCPAGDVCSSYLFFNSGNGLCLKTCALQTDCRVGYSCQSDGQHMVCSH